MKKSRTWVATILIKDDGDPTYVSRNELKELLIKDVPAGISVEDFNLF